MWVALVATVVAYGPLAVCAYFLFRDPADLYETERRRVVQDIERLRDKHGAYPKYGEHVQPVVSDTFFVNYYEATDDDFYIELSRSRLFPPGETTWTYDSKKGTWHCRSESW